MFWPIEAVCSKADWGRHVPDDAIGLDGDRFGDLWRSSAIAQSVDGRASAERLDADPATRSSATDVSVSWLELLEGSTARTRADTDESVRRRPAVLVPGRRSCRQRCELSQRHFGG